MKLGVYNAILHDRPLEDAIKVIADLGLNGIEINSGGFLPPVHIPEIDEIIAELRIHDALGQRHADGFRDALPEGTGRQFDSIGVRVLRMPRRLAADLPEAFELVEGHVGIAREIEQAVEEHRCVSVGKDQPIPIDPVGGGCIKLHELLEQDRRNVGQPHWRTRMAAVGILYCIHCKEANTVRQRA